MKDISKQQNTPRQFRNALYEHLVANDVSIEIASSIAGEAEIYADGYEAYKLRDITFAVRQMGFQPSSPKFGTNPQTERKEP